MVPRFVKVMPNDYKRMLACIERAHGQGLTGEKPSWRPLRRMPTTFHA